MKLQTAFHDKYRFYQAFLLPSRNGGVFIPTTEPCNVGDTGEIDVQIQSPRTDLKLQVKVIGRRQAVAGVLPAGVNVMLTDVGENEARSLLDLTPVTADFAPLRRHFRYPVSVPVSLLEPFSPNKLRTLDLSSGGARITLPPRFRLGAKVTVELDLGIDRVERSGSVVWLDIIKGVTQGGLQFSTPLELTREQAQLLLATQNRASAQRTVLVADDDVAIARCIENYLTGLNYRVVAVQSGDEAISMAREYNPDLLILDILMPRMDGFEVCAILRRDAHFAAVPIIIISAMDSHHVDASVASINANCFLQKPFSLASLGNAVKNALGEGTPAPAPVIATT